MAVAAICAMCVTSARPRAAPQTTGDDPKPLHFGTWGVDLRGMDRSTNPGDDFDRYVNGAWASRTEIPADQASTGVGDDVYNLSQAQIRAIIEGAPPATQLGAMYRSFMDEARVESLDARPLAADLNDVKAIADREAFTTFMGRTNGRFGIALFSPSVGADMANPEMNGLYLGQAGLGLPDRDFYLSDAFKTQRDAYRAYIERTFAMIGNAAPATSADTVMTFETTIA